MLNQCLAMLAAVTHILFAPVPPFPERLQDAVQVRDVVQVQAGSIEAKSIGRCSGFIVKPNVVVTARHCVGRNPLLVSFSSAPPSVPATVLSQSEGEEDWAILSVKTPFSDAPPAKIQTKVPNRGDRLAAIGYPGNALSSIAVQFLSIGVFLTFDSRHKVYWVGKVVYPGESGSPIFTDEGAIIGLAKQAYLYGGEGHPATGLTIVEPAAHWIEAIP